MKRTKKDVRKENIKFVTKCISCFLMLLIFCPGFISLLVGYAIGYTFYSFVVRFYEKYILTISVSFPSQKVQPDIPI